MMARMLIPGLLLAMLAPAAAAAQVPDSSDAARIRQAVAQGQALPLPHILAIARRHVSGDVLRIDMQDMADRLAYDIRILAPDGRLRSIMLDARSGAIIRIERK
jgi:uncharacterized membrane protein YkoI